MPKRLILARVKGIQLPSGAHGCIAERVPIGFVQHRHAGAHIRVISKVGASGPQGVAVDAGHVWTNFSAGTIGRADLDGAWSRITGGGDVLTGRPN